MPTAFKATYSDWKLVKTRGVVQIVFEVPLAEADDAYELLGGMPIIAKERWFGIAAIKSPEEKEAPAKPRQSNPPSPHPDGAKRDWRDLPPAQQAGIRCEEPVFAAFLKETRKDDWHETQDAADCVRLICGVESRSELGTNQRARIIWHQLDSAFQVWKVMEHA
jgi:hypothetical protein